MTTTTDTAAKQEIKVQLLVSDDNETLMAHGEHSKEAVIAAAVEQTVIDPDYAEKYATGEYGVNWYHASPKDGYTAWYSVSKEGVRGSFKATTINLAW